MNYLWLMAGNEIHVLKGLQYFHRVNGYDKQGHGSNYVKYAAESAPQADKIEKQMSLMR
jgi:3-deoxy-D-arabino-heptulosonate 7-phosphate (DAHP) synthase